MVYCPVPYTAEKFGEQFEIPSADKLRSLFLKKMFGETPLVRVRPREEKPVKTHCFPKPKGEVSIHVFPHDKLLLVSSDSNIKVFTHVRGKRGARKELLWMGGNEDGRPKYLFVQKENFTVFDHSNNMLSSVRFTHTPLSRRS